MGLFNRKSKKNQNRQIIEIAIHRLLKYVSSRDENGNEIILGRDGRINIKNGRLYVTCDGIDVFSCDTETMEFGELLSHEGVRIVGIDSDGRKKSVVCKYY